MMRKGLPDKIAGKVSVKSARAESLGLQELPHGGILEGPTLATSADIVSVRISIEMLTIGQPEHGEPAFWLELNPDVGGRQDALKGRSGGWAVENFDVYVIGSGPVRAAA